MDSLDYKGPSELMKQEKVWMIFEGTKARPDGSKPKYRCERLTEKYVDQVLKYMPEFMKEEMVNRSLRASDLIDRNIELASDVWRNTMFKGYSIACVTDEDQPKLVGFNVNNIEKWPVEIAHILPHVKEDIFKAQLKALADLKNSYNIADKFGVNEFMDAFGLFVLPEYRGQGIAVNILLARVPLCKSLGIKVTANSFSSNAVRRSAVKAGFEVYSEISTEDYQKRYGIVMHDVENEYVKFMGKAIV